MTAEGAPGPLAGGLHAIPYQGKAIIYRPLRRLAFIGNQAMARLCEGVFAELGGAAPAAGPADEEALQFLQAVGFLERDEPLAGEGAAEDAFRPASCVLFLTDACNLRCVYCYAAGGAKRAGEAKVQPLALSRAAIDAVSRNARDRGLGRFSLGFHGGGEPTMAWPALKACVAHARKAQLPAKISLTSNGVWTGAQRAWILDNIDEISLSLDGPASIQDRQRPRASGRGSHAAVAKAVQALDRRRAGYGVRVTVTERSAGLVPEIVEHLCQETGAGAIQVEPAFSRGRARQDGQAVSRLAEFAASFLEGHAIASRHGRHMHYSGARPWLLTGRFCQAVTDSLIVGPDGFLTACYEVCDRSHELSGDFLFGALDERAGVQADLGARRRLLAKIEERRQGCQGCFCFYHCAGDCPSKTFSGQPGGHLLRGERCELNREITKELIVRQIEAGGGVWRGGR